MKGVLYPIRLLHGKVHEWIIKTFSIFEERLHLLRERICHPGAVYLVLTPEHGNLGDHAIAKAETDILQRLGINYIEVTGKRLLSWHKNGLLSVMNGRTILVNGGGNIGSLWPDVEELMEETVANNPRSSILILPNTCYFSRDEIGNTILRKSCLKYNSHKNIILYARENSSFTIMKTLYKRVKTAPDMVLRMNQCKRGVIREGCILCLRSDREKTRSEEMETSIIRQVHALFGEHIRHLDMIVPHEIPISERDVELEKQYDAFRHAELVITDRLHGMIFCAITGTPCIVINSKSPKVRGCYEWINDLPYIQFCEDVNQISSIYRSIPKKEWTYDETRLLPRYKELEADILKAAKGRMICL